MNELVYELFIYELFVYELFVHEIFSYEKWLSKIDSELVEKLKCMI